MTTQPCTKSPDVWFSTDAELIAVAKRLCLDCPLFDPCTTLIRGLESDGHIEDGVWAGLTPKERNQRPKRRRPPQPGPRYRRTCVCLECGTEDIHGGKGLCLTCYRRAWREAKKNPDTPTRTFSRPVTSSVIGQALRMEAAGMTRADAARELGVSWQALQKAVERSRQTMERSA